MCSAVFDFRDMEDDDLTVMYRNCVHQISNATRFAEIAEEKLVAIHAEFSRRIEALGAGRRFVETPQVGMLRTMGYRVGNGGEREAARRKILDFVMSRELPLVGSVTYTFEWGTPLSRKRFCKLLRTLEGLTVANEGRDEMVLACTHWTEDRDYVVQTWGGRVG